ncbi:MAG TPA: HAD family hydrolase, partial [Planctomycetaceae bacterium]|nr:HAD family hydrolase [Planctomycetaceae bacterium]
MARNELKNSSQAKTSAARLTRNKRGDLKITLISLHGLIRGHDCELGRDADTGGQVKYVLELARELAAHSHVREVELL